MKIIVNSVPHEISDVVLSVALVDLGFTGAAIATALNGQFVPRDAHVTTTLSEGDRLEVLAPMQGG